MRKFTKGGSFMDVQALNGMLRMNAVRDGLDLLARNSAKRPLSVECKAAVVWKSCVVLGFKVVDIYEESKTVMVEISCPKGLRRSTYCVPMESVFAEDDYLDVGRKVLQDYPLVRGEE